MEDDLDLPLNHLSKSFNFLLAERYVFQPDLSTVTAQVTAITSAIKHQVDILAFEKGYKTRKLQQEVDIESDAVWTSPNKVDS